jgi:hypothetical protein
LSMAVSTLPADCSEVELSGGVCCCSLGKVYKSWGVRGSLELSFESHNRLLCPDTHMIRVSLKAGRNQAGHCEPRQQAAGTREIRRVNNLPGHTAALSNM